MIFEIIGVAGTGKTTISDALGQANKHINTLYDLRSWQNFSKLARGVAEILPFAWRELPTARFTRQEWNWMARLRALQHIAQSGEHRGAAKHQQITLLDQGPIYTLARLSESAIWTKHSQHVTHRRDSIFTHWASALDGIVWLDAPTSVLLERIYNRRKWHVIQTMPYTEGSAWLDWHKSLYAQTMKKLATHGDAKIHRFDTEQMPLDEIVGEVSKLVACSAPSDPSGASSPEPAFAAGTHQRESWR